MDDQAGETTPTCSSYSELQWKWRTGFIIAAMVSRSDDVERAKADWDDKRLNGNFDQSIGIQFYNVINIVYSMHWRANLIDRVPSEFKKYIEAIYLDGTNYANYQCPIVIIIFTQAGLNHLTELSRLRATSQGDPYNNLVNTILERAFPRFEAVIGRPSDKWRAYRHVLCLEPTEPLLSTPADAHQQVELAKKVRSWLGAEQTIHIPAIVQDSMLVPGPAYGNGDRSCVVIRLEPLPTADPDPRSARIPILAMSYIDHIIRSHIRRNLIDRLNGARRSINEKFSTAQFDDIGLYARPFLDARASAEADIFEAEDAELDLPKFYRCVHLVDGDFRDFRDEIVLNSVAGNFMKKTVPFIVRQQDGLLAAELRKAIADTTKRLQATDALLRDRTAAAATDLNLLIARSVRRLMWLATIIGVAALAIGLLTDTLKERIISSAVRLFHLIVTKL